MVVNYKIWHNFLLKVYLDVVHCLFKLKVVVQRCFRLWMSTLEFSLDFWTIQFGSGRYKTWAFCHGEFVSGERMTRLRKILVRSRWSRRQELGFRVLFEDFYWFFGKPKFGLSYHWIGFRMIWHVDSKFHFWRSLESWTMVWIIDAHDKDW